MAIGESGNRSAFISTNGPEKLGGAILQLVALQRVPELVVTEVECRRRRPLVEAIAPERVFEKLPLIFRDGSAEVVGARRRRRWHRIRDRLFAFNGGNRCWCRLPRRR